MSNEPTIIDESKVRADLAVIADRARGYAERAKAASTRHAYQTDFQAFVRWCRAHRLTALPAGAETIAAYLTAHAGSLKVTTLARHLSSIREAHRQVGYDDVTRSAAFREVWRGIRNEHGAPATQKAPLVTAMLRKAIAALPDTLIGKRDRALLLVGFAAALRRIELVTLEARHRDGAAGWITEAEEGLKVHLARSKTDQEGDGVVIGVPYGSNPETCPVRAYRAWLAISGIAEGPAFRSINRHGHLGRVALTDRSVARIVQRTVKAAALAAGMSEEDAEAEAGKFAGHSLRAGLATSSAANDAPGHVIQRHLRHARFDTTVKYILAASLFKDNPATLAGL